MSDSQPFTVRSNTATRWVGVIIVAMNGGSVAVAMMTDAHPSHALGALFPAVIIAALGVFLILEISAIEVDPLAGTFTRRKGIWPFVKRTQHAFSEVEDLLEDEVKRRTGRAKVERRFNRLRIRFTDGSEWTVLEEFYTGTKVRAMGERLAKLTGLLLTSG